NLPLAMIALIDETAAHAARSNADITITERLELQFWLKNEKYRASDGSESAFYAYVDHDTIRTKLLSHVSDWISPHQAKLTYLGMGVDIDAYALVLTFRFSHTFPLCMDADVTHPDECLNASISVLFSAGDPT